MQGLQSSGAARPGSLSYTVRAIDHSDPADRRLLLPLLMEYFQSIGGTDVAERYRWLYLDNPSGVARTYVACAGGRAVGATSLFPRAVRVGEHQATGAIGGDGYVTPSFRRRGIVTALHREAVAGMDDRLSFMFGPPEPDNLRALLRAGATLTGSVRRYVRALSARGLGRLGARVPLACAASWLLRARPSELRVEKLRAPSDPRVQSVWQATEEAPELRGQVVPIADAEFYAWRFGDPAAARQVGVVVLDRDEPIGVAALERSDRTVMIVNVTCPPASFRRVVRAILASLTGADAVAIEIHAPSPRRELALRTLGFWPRGQKQFQVHVPQSHPAKELLTRGSAWNFMPGDGDVSHLLEATQ